MADQDDVHRIALALPETTEAGDRFSSSVQLIFDAWRCQARRALVVAVERDRS
jgi:hypothetical protein